MDRLKHGETTDLLIKAFFHVYNTLGHGFLEKVYENAMIIEARKLGLNVKQQVPIQVSYGGKSVGEYFVDLIADNKVIVELKVAKKLAPEHEAQLLNYLKSTTYEVGLLLNFGERPEFSRKVMDNKRKGSLAWYKVKKSVEIRG